MSVDLRICKPGDILICRTGAIVTYLGPTDKSKPEGYYDHRVKYLYIPDAKYKDLGEGTRIDSGHVMRSESARLDTDHDVVAILSKKDFKKLWKSHKKFISLAN